MPRAATYLCTLCHNPGLQFSQMGFAKKRLVCFTRLTDNKPVPQHDYFEYVLR